MEGVDVGAVSEDVFEKYKARGRAKGPWAGIFLALLRKALPDLIELILESLHNAVPDPAPSPTPTPAK